MKILNHKLIIEDKSRQRWKDETKETNTIEYSNLYYVMCVH